MGPSKRRFEQVFSEGKRVQGRFLKIAALPGEGQVGFATAKKIGNRPRRNRVRRRLQAAFREIGYPFQKRLDLVIIAGAAAEGVEIQEVRNDLRDLLESIEGRWASESECS